MRKVEVDGTSRFALSQTVKIGTRNVMSVLGLTDTFRSARRILKKICKGEVA